MPMAPAINRGLRIHGGVTRPTNSRTWSSLTNDTNAGTWMPDCDARSRIASVAEEARLRLTHAGYAQVLAHGRGLLEIEVVERHNPVDPPRACEMADAEQRIPGVPLLVGVGHVEDFVDAVARPLGILETFRRHEQHCTVLAPQLAEQVDAFVFVVAGEAEDSERGCHRRG